MFSKKKSESQIQETIDRLLEALAAHQPSSESYSKTADQLVKLYPLLEQDAPKRINPDTLALVLGNLAGIAMIVGHERAHVVTSKALGFVLKLR